MQTPTIVKETKDYLLVKIPLPSRTYFRRAEPEKEKMTSAEKRLWKIIQDGEREHKEGKTIKAASIDEALKIYERRKNKED
jgi:hypothetical protein